MEALENILPAEWKDDEVMNVMFSPFRDRELNPQSWDKKFTFWQRLIHDFCMQANDPVVEVNKLRNSFMRGGKRPACLEVVLGKMAKDNQIKRMSEFETASTQGWLSWGVDWLVKKPVKWSFQMAWSMIGGDNNVDVRGEFIVLDVLKSLSSSLLSRLQHIASTTLQTVIGYYELREQAKDVCGTDQSLRLALMQLVNEKQISVMMTESGQVIRLLKPNNDMLASPRCDEVAIKIHRLHETERKLQGEIQGIRLRIEQHRQEAKVHLSNGRKSSALAQLRSKKMLERGIAKREESIEKIHQMVQQIHDADSHKQIIDAYSMGSSVLRQMREDSGLTLDRVDDVMTDVAEEFDTQAEINASISHGAGNLPLDVSNDDLERELNEILGIDQSPQINVPSSNLESRMARLRVGQKDLDLPSVPTFDPTTPPRNLQRHNPKHLQFA